MGRLQDRVAIVTGAGRGLGRAIAEGFAAEGALVAVNDIRPKAAQETAEALSDLAVPGDVTNEAQVQKMVADTVAHYGKLDVMMGNAGIIQTKSIIDTTVDDWERMFKINSTGMFICLREAARVMVKQGHGRIIALVSDDATFLTGQAINVSGGLVMH